MRNLRFRARPLPSLVATAIFLWPAFSSAIVVYHVTDLGTLGGTESYAYGINNSGQVVGFSFTSGVSVTTERAFRTMPNSVINPATDNLGTLGGFASSARAINDLGQVVGYSYLSDGNSHGFRTKPNAPISVLTDDLGTLGGTQSQANGINDLGEVVGQSFIAGNGHELAFRTAPNSAINPSTDNLGALGGLSSFAFGINNNGQASGYASLPGDSHGHAFRTSGRTAINPATDDIGIAVGGDSSGAGINDLGQAVGSANFGGTQNNAFRTGSNASINPATDNLGRLSGTLSSIALRINEKGWAVGSSSISSFYHATLHDGSSLIDLNSVLDSSGVGWVLTVANDINDHDQIVGYGTYNGVTRAFRLDLVPEPSTIVLIGFALFGLAAFTRPTHE